MTAFKQGLDRPAGRKLAAATMSLAVLLASAAPGMAQSAARGTGRDDLGASAEPDYPTEPTIDEIIAAHRDAPRTRIVGGYEAKPGQWPSMVAIFVRRPDGSAVNFCGGTVIGREWVLTAAHCAAAMKKVGDVSPFFVKEGTIDLGQGGGHDVPVAAIVINEHYRPKETLNDIALMKVAGTLDSQRQKLIGGSEVGDVVVADRMATVVGFGVTEEKGSAPARLQQVDIPIVAKAVCQKVYGPNLITDANFCAGMANGGRDSCQGDSGGPLFMPVPTDGEAEALQSGVVSWGKGCARPGLYGVYGSVGLFEDWIRSRVRDVVFVDKPAAAPASPPGGGLTDGAAEASKPGRLAQITIDIAEGNKVKVDTYMHIRVTSSVDGAVVVFNQNPDGRVYQVYPSKTFPAPGPEPFLARITAGQALSIPSVQQETRHALRIEPPTGVNRLRVVVVPPSEAVDKILRQHYDNGELSDLKVAMQELIDAELQSRGPVGVEIDPIDRGSAEKLYDIVP